MLTLQNQNLTLCVDPFGAQMMELGSKQGTQFLWNGDKQYWPDRAPVLFPYVARLTDGCYTLCGERYSMDIHGFAKDSVFTIEEQSSDSVTFCLRQTPETLRQYPFRFTFRVRYALRGWTVHVTYSVCNEDEKELPFGIGGHPGFQIAPGHARSEYSIALPDANPRHYLLLDAAGSGLADTSKSYPFNDAGNAYVPVTDTLFDKDALGFEDGQLPSVGLVDADKKPFVTLTCTDFPYVGIWSKPDGPYVCLEPWIGRTDNMDFTGDLSEKPGEQKLIANAETVHTYTIEFHSSI